MTSRTLHRYLISSLSALVTALGLAACGGSGQAGFTAGGSPPTKPSEIRAVRPSREMADEAEALVTGKLGDTYASPDCVPADSLDGTGEFNFDCTAENRRLAERIKLNVVVLGSDAGEPELGPVTAFPCEPVNARGEDLPRAC